MTSKYNKTKTKNPNNGIHEDIFHDEDEPVKTTDTTHKFIYENVLDYNISDNIHSEQPILLDVNVFKMIIRALPNGTFDDQLLKITRDLKKCINASQALDQLKYSTMLIQFGVDVRQWKEQHDITAKKDRINGRIKRESNRLLTKDK